MNFITDFIGELQGVQGRSNLCNPYHLPNRSENLQIYLETLFAQPGRRILVVGEALGYRGGLHTGIPFSSARLVRQSSHAFWRRLRNRLVVHSNISEATASIVWDYLGPRRRIPLFWNALPFHPHDTGEPLSNRAPSAAEIDLGQRYLRLLADAWQPEIVAGVGNKGSLAARRALPEYKVQDLRHPSYGGKQAFCSGMDRLLG